MEQHAVYPGTTLLRSVLSVPKARSQEINCQMTFSAPEPESLFPSPELDLITHRPTPVAWYGCLEQSADIDSKVPQVHGESLFDQECLPRSWAGRRDATLAAYLPSFTDASKGLPALTLGPLSEEGDNISLFVSLKVRAGEPKCSSVLFWHFVHVIMSWCLSHAGLGILRAGSWNPVQSLVQSGHQ